MAPRLERSTLVRPTIDRLIGVYHADGGLRGELAYALGKLRGTAHCALCDLTHRGPRRNPAWSRLTANLTVPFGLVHLNERSQAVERASHGRTPCVLAHTSSGLVLLLDPDDLERAGGDIARFAAAMYEAAQSAGLRWPAATTRAD
jgi:hypothetical protein